MTKERFKEEIENAKNRFKGIGAPILFINKDIVVRVEHYKITDSEFEVLAKDGALVMCISLDAIKELFYV